MDVLCVGHAAWDISVFVRQYPAENSKCETPALLECCGGPAANAAFLLSRWNMACALAASIGADAYGDRVLREVAEAGIDVLLIQRSPAAATPVSVIVVNETNGSRTIINRKSPGAGGSGQGSEVSGQGSEGSGQNSLTTDHRPLTTISAAWDPPPRVLLFDGHEPEASVEAMAAWPQALTVLDAGSARPGAVELARRVDFLVSSERFARQLSGLPDLESSANQVAALRTLHRHNGRPVVITLGERGTLYGTGDELHHLPAFPATAVDTTGAGDIFHGAFVYGLLTGLALAETLRLAAAAAALSVAVRGSRTSIPTLAQVQELLAHAG